MSGGLYQVVESPAGEKTLDEVQLVVPDIFVKKTGNETIDGFKDFKQRLQAKALELGHGNDLAYIDFHGNPDSDPNLDYAQRMELNNATGNVMLTPGMKENAADNDLATAKFVNDKVATALPKSGGTMSGSLTIVHATYPFIYLQNNSSDITSPPASNIYEAVSIRDKNNQLLAGLDIVQGKSGLNIASIFAKNKQDDGSDVLAEVKAIAARGGVSYATAPATPANSVGAEIVVASHLNSHAPMKLVANTNIYVGGANASDTADLWAGRGFSADKPFATLAGALSWVTKNCAGDVTVSIILCGDAQLSDYWIKTGNFSNIQIQSDGTKRKLSLIGDVRLILGNLTLANLRIERANPSSYILYVNANSGDATLIIGDGVELSGTANVAVIGAEFGGKVIARSTISGSPTGKRYRAASGGRIFTGGKGDTFIPGTEAGTVETASGSVYY